MSKSLRSSHTQVLRSHPKSLLAAMAGALTAAIVAGAGALAAPGGSPGKPIAEPPPPAQEAEISVEGVGTSPLPLLSFSFGVTNSSASGVGGGAGAGKATFQDLHFTKRVDDTSPIFMLATATGEHFRKATVRVKNAGGSQPYLIYTLTDVLVTSYQNSGSSGDARPVDQISIDFGKVELEVDGTRTGFDVKASKKI